MKISAEALISWLRQAEWLLFLAVGPLFLFPSPRRVALLFVLPVLLLIHFILWRRPLPLTPFNIPLLLMALMILVSLWATTDLGASLPKISGLVYGLLAFFMVTEQTSSERRWGGGLVLLISISLGVILLAIAGGDWNSKLFSIAWLSSFLPKSLLLLPGAEDGFHPIEIAGSLLWILPVTAAAAWNAWTGRFPFTSFRRRGLWVGLFGFTFLLGCGTLILTQARGAFLGLALSGLLIVSAVLTRKWKRLAGVFGLLFAGCTALLFWFGPKIAASIQTALPVASGDALSLNSLALRLVIWSRAVEGLKDFAWTGMGLNRFRTLLDLLYPALELHSAGVIGHAHNEFLQAGLDLGLVGLVALIAIYFCAFWMLFRLCRMALRLGAQGRGLLWMVSAIFGGLFSHFLFGLTDAVALGAKPGLLFWILLGLLASLYRQVTDPPGGIAAQMGESSQGGVR